MDLTEFGRKIKIKKTAVDKDFIFTPQNSQADLLFESIIMPPWSWLLTMEDLGTLHWIATSKSLAGNAEKRQAYMNQVMNTRGFKFMAGGTNRNVFKHPELPNVVAKVPIDRVGMSDNDAEFKNQYKIWPYCAKTIQVAPGGIVGFAEKLDPILNRIQFNAFAAMIYMTTIEIVGKYVLEDIGEKYFKNWAIRKGMGCALVDYPYIFELDGNKLICNNPDPINGFPCGGEIDYDEGFNELRCRRCHKLYHAAELQLFLTAERIQINRKKKGQKPMKVKLMKGNQVLAGDYASDSIVKPSVPTPYTPGNSTMKVTFRKGDTVLASSEVPVTPNTPVVDETRPGMEKVSYEMSIGEPIAGVTTKEIDPFDMYPSAALPLGITPEMLGDMDMAEAYRKAMAQVGGLEVVSGGQDEKGVFLNLANGDRIEVPWQKLTEAIGDEMSGSEGQEEAVEAEPESSVAGEVDKEEEESGVSGQDAGEVEESPAPVLSGLNIPQSAIDAVDGFIGDNEFKTSTKPEDVLDAPTPAAMQAAEAHGEFPPNQWGAGATINRPTRRRVMTSDSSDNEERVTRTH